MAGCSVYATDTVVVLYDADCTTLEGKKVDFAVKLKNQLPVLSWTSFINNRINYYELERSLDGTNFETIKTIQNSNPGLAIKTYSFTDTELDNNIHFYYRVKMVFPNEIQYTHIANIELPGKNGISMYPNPAISYVQLSVLATKNESVKMTIFSIAGELLYTRDQNFVQGFNAIKLQNLSEWKPGIYIVRLNSPSINQWQKLIIER